MFRLFYDSSISDFTSVLSQETDSKMTRTFVIQEATESRMHRFGVRKVGKMRRDLSSGESRARDPANTEPIVAQEMHIHLPRYYDYR